MRALMRRTASLSDRSTSYNSWDRLCVPVLATTVSASVPAESSPRAATRRARSSRVAVIDESSGPGPPDADPPHGDIRPVYQGRAYSGAGPETGTGSIGGAPIGAGSPFLGAEGGLDTRPEGDDC